MSTPKKSIKLKPAYVKKQRSVAKTSTKSNKNIEGVKTFYPPGYDKAKGCMAKLPRIQRFNEDISETASVASK